MSITFTPEQLKAVEEGSLDNEVMRAVIPNYIYLSLSYKGKIMDYVNPKTDNWDGDINHLLRNAIPAYRYIRRPMSELDYWKSFFNDTVLPDDTIESDRNSRYIKFADFFGAVNENDYVAEFQNKDRMIMETDVDVKSFLVNKALTGNVEIVDRLAISSGAANVGSGQVYLTWVSAWGDVVALTGDLIFTQTSNITETAARSITINVGTYLFTNTSNSKPNGDPTAGWTITENHTGSRCFELDGSASTGHVSIMDGLHQEAGGSSPSAFIRIDANNSWRYKVKGCMFDGKGSVTNGLQLKRNPSIGWTWNNYFWDLTNGIDLVSNAQGNCIAENNSFYNCGTGIDLDVVQLWAYQVYNNTFLSCTADVIGPDNATGKNNSTTLASGSSNINNGEWSTGSGNITGITQANEVLSVSDSSSDFLDIKSGGSNQDGGIAVTITDNTSGARGRPRPHSGNYSIGACEFQAAAADEETQRSYPLGVARGVAQGVA